MRSTDVAIFVVTVTMVGPANALNWSNTDIVEVAVFVVVAGSVLVERSDENGSDEAGVFTHANPEHPFGHT